MGDRDDFAADEIQLEGVAQNIALKEQRAAVRKVNVDNRVGLGSVFQSFGDTEPVAEMADAVVPQSRQRTDYEANAKRELEEVVTSIIEVKQSDVSSSPIRRGWVSAMVDSEERWMAWSGLPDGDNFIGVWLNREAIVAELSKAVSLSQQGGLRFRLIDAQGAVVVGDFAPRYGSQAPSSPELSLAVGSALPHWRIETFRANGANTFGNSFRLVGGLFIFGLSFAILLGSTVLIWQARRDARDAERKTTFVANVSHELKTPLTSIRLFADMLHDGRVKDPAKQRQYLQTMANETQRLTRLVNNVLDFSRLERGSHRAKQEQIDVGELVGSIVEAQRERLHADGLELNYQAPSKSLEANIDSDALEQILLNLLDNAAKYANLGERADITVEESGTGWTLHVRDYGPGIPPSEKKRIFQAFQRIDDRLTSDRPGCGLGLCIAARLAQEMGGTLTLEENQPTGCSFILKIHA